MKLLRKLVWQLFSSVRAATIDSGVRKRKYGRYLFAGLNRVCRLGLKVTQPFMSDSVVIQGSRMHLAGWEKPALPFTLKMLFDRFEEGTTLLFERIIQPGMVVIDAGAHFGYFTLLAARLVGPEGRVYAFEPDEASYALLERNVQLNKYTNVFLVRKALLDQTGPLRLFLNPLGSEGHSIYEINAGSGARSVEVEGTTLDDWLEGQGWPQVDLVKIDVEGAELASVKGMNRALRDSCVQRLIVEFAPVLLKGGGTNGRDFLDTLYRLGFRLSTIEENGVLQPLEPSIFPALLRRLEKETLINLFCERVMNGTHPGDPASIHRTFAYNKARPEV